MQSEQQGANSSGEGGPHPHPYLHDPILYISALPPHVTDENLAYCFASCAPFRPKIPRDDLSKPLSGTIEFKFLEKAEMALATLQGLPIPGANPTANLVLSPYPPTTPPTPLPPPNASPRLVKQLPSGYTDTQLYLLFRPFGALASARTHTAFGKDTGVVEFWNEDDAKLAEREMHCADVEGQNIAVQIYQPRRTPSGNHPEFSASAPSFVPGGHGPFAGAFSPQYSPHSPPRAQPYPLSPGQITHTLSPGHPALQLSPGHPQNPLPMRSPVTPPHPLPHHATQPNPLSFIHGPGQQVQLAPLSGPGSNSHSGLIDPCNLFCKNLDSSIDSNGLFQHFHRFGHIVSARVMRTEAGESRGFGFVSFQTPDQAAAALHAMNGMVIGSKQLVVRLHEPKQLRQEKLAQRFGGGNGHPRSASGATSPTASEGGDSTYLGPGHGWASPGGRSQKLAGGASPRYGALKLEGTGLGLGRAGHVHGMQTTQEKVRRGSGSYYNAALSGTLNMHLDYDTLSSLTPVVRREVLTGELSRRLKAMDIMSSEEVDPVVEKLVSLSLSEIVAGLADAARLSHQIDVAREKLHFAPISDGAGNGNGQATRKSPSPSRSNVSQDSRLLAAEVLNATASAPDHPSTPISVSVSSTPPRTSSPSGSVLPSNASEKDRIRAAVEKLEGPGPGVEGIVDLMMTLPKRERALCLFNVEVLRSKVADAKNVLASLEEEDESEETPVPAAPATPARRATAPPTGVSPRTPDLSSRGPSAAASPVPVTPTSNAQTQQQPTALMRTLADQRAEEILKILREGDGVPGVEREDPLVRKATEEWVEGLRNEKVQLRKSQAGDRVRKLCKALGVKNTAKVTIYLVDNNDWDALVHLVDSYPSIMKLKIQKAVAVLSG